MKALLAVLAVAIVATGTTVAEEPESIAFDDPLPYGQSPLDYHAEPADDAVARFGGKLAAGEAELRHDENLGYLPALLDALDVPVESQLLTFAKTALNPRLVGPDNPRAIYFGEGVYVGYVPGAAALELTAIDPVKGAVFYTLDQDRAEVPRFRREQRCLACHAGSTTLRVPGLLVRSFLTDENGRPRSGWSRITHERPLEKRCGGWFVTGTVENGSHRGNLLDPRDADRYRDEPGFRSSVEDLSELVDLSRYPSRHSDLVAHLVLQHELHGRNLLTRVAYEERIGRRSDAEDRLLRYLFFVDEPELPGRVTGTSGFREWFESRGPKDDRGRSLRMFNLRTRLFEHRLSYLVRTEQFEQLPDAVRKRMRTRIDEVLAGANPTPEFAKIPAEERRVIRQALSTPAGSSGGKAPPTVRAPDHGR